MKLLFTREQAQQLDKISADEFFIQGRELMERAGREVAGIVIKEIKKQESNSVLILCGKGNNGGDGFSTAIELIKKSVDVRIHSLYNKESFNEDSRYFLDLCLDLRIPISFGIDLVKFNFNHCIILDAILGIGFKNFLKKTIIPWVEFINKSNSTVISIDIPTGLDSNSGLIKPIAVKSSITATMGFKKIGMVFQNGKEYCGRIKILDIGFPKVAYNKTKGLNWFEFDDNDISKTIIRSKAETNKFKQGKVLIISGSIGMTGAASLCALGAMRIGAGLVTLVIPKSVNTIIETKLTEAITYPLDDKNKGYLFHEHLNKILEKCELVDSVIIGPGIGRNMETQKLVIDLVSKINKPIVLDADGLFPFNDNLDRLNDSKSELIITPHFGEMSRLVNLTKNKIVSDFPYILENFVNNFKHSGLVKQVPACSFFNDSIVINCSGNPGLATAGTGDILSGIIGGLLAMGIRAKKAIPFAVYIHGKASDILVKDKGCRGQIASDIAEHIPYVIKEYEGL